MVAKVAKTIQQFNRTGSTQNRPRHGRTKKLSARAQRHIQRLWLGNRRMSAASIAAQVEGVGVSLPVLRPYAAHCIKLVCLAIVPEGDVFLFFYHTPLVWPAFTVKFLIFFQPFYAYCLLWSAHYFWNLSQSNEMPLYSFYSFSNCFSWWVKLLQLFFPNSIKFFSLKVNHVNSV